MTVASTNTGGVPCAALGELRDRVADAAGRGVPLRLRGSGTKDFYAERIEGQILELGAYRGIVDYEPSELVITARCGTRVSEIEAALAAQGQFLAFEPPCFGGDPTIGGVIAAGLSGPRRMQVGAVRDFVLGAKLLNASGEELCFGGRVMKNVAGFDVSRLLCGSLGILGIITEVSLKVLPRPRCERTLALRLSAADAIALFNRWGSLPLPISGAAWSGGRAWVRLSGAAPAVEEATCRIDADPVDEAAASALWDGLRHFTHPFFDAEQVWRVSVPSAAALLDTSAVAVRGTDAPRVGARGTDGPGGLLIDWGGALRWYTGALDSTSLREAAARARGTALCWRGPAVGPRFHPLAPAVMEIHRRLKRRFDPLGIFNRGRLHPAL